MADSDHLTSGPPAQTATLQPMLPDGARGIVSFGPYRLLTTPRRLEQAGRPIPLGDCEFDLLCTLTERAGEIVSNRELTARVWGEFAVGKGTLRLHINALRKALSPNGTEAPYIRKVARCGYIFTAPMCRRITGGNNALWDGHIIDASVPLM